VSIIYVLIPLALVILAAGIGAWVWAVRRGQYDDMTTPAVRMLNDDVGEKGHNGHSPP